MDEDKAREAMVARQIAARGVDDPAVLAAMREVPRDAFVAPDCAGDAYRDSPLPIGEGQTISQPYIVAAMIATAGLAPGARVLEIGSGCGYAAAVMSRIAAEVFAIERHAVLAEQSRATLDRLGYANVRVRTGDGGAGWPEAAPFDAILVSAAAATLPEPLPAQLAPGGHLVIPLDAGPEQRLLCFTRGPGDELSRTDLGPVRFVPLVGN